MSNTYNPAWSGDSHEVANRIMTLLPDTKGNAENDQYSASSLTALQTIIAAFQLIGQPYRLDDIKGCFMDVDALKHVESQLILEYPDANETAGWLSLMKTYHKGDYFSFDRFQERLAGLIGRLSQFSNDSLNQNVQLS